MFQSLAALVFTVSVIVNLRGLRSQSRLRANAAARASSAPRAGGGDAALKLAVVPRGPEETAARLASYVGARRAGTLVYNRIPKTGSTSLTQSLNWLATESGGRFRDRSTPFDVEVLGREWWWDERDGNPRRNGTANVALGGARGAGGGDFDARAAVARGGVVGSSIVDDEDDGDDGARDVRAAVSADARRAREDAALVARWRARVETAATSGRRKVLIGHMPHIAFGDASEGGGEAQTGAPPPLYINTIRECGTRLVSEFYFGRLHWLAAGPARATARRLRRAFPHDAGRLNVTLDECVAVPACVELMLAPRAATATRYFCGARQAPCWDFAPARAADERARAVGAPAGRAETGRAAPRSLPLRPSDAARARAARVLEDEYLLVIPTPAMQAGLEMLQCLLPEWFEHRGAGAPAAAASRDQPSRRLAAADAVPPDAADADASEQRALRQAVESSALASRDARARASVAPPPPACTGGPKACASFVPSKNRTPWGDATAGWATPSSHALEQVDQLCERSGDTALFARAVARFCEAQAALVARGCAIPSAPSAICVGLERDS